MNLTPESQRLHIVLLGNRNSGKSSLLNAVAGQRVSIVSDTPGTTTDQVHKPMEIIGLGPCVLIDTAGLDDTGELGQKRVQGSLDAVKSADIVLAVLDASECVIPPLPRCGVPVLPVVNKADKGDPSALNAFCLEAEKKFGVKPIVTNAREGEGVRELVRAIRECIPEDWDAPLLTAGLLEEGELAVLVMPQDRLAPKGRLILPQQQVIRELLDRKCRIACCDADTLPSTLESLNESPKAIIADSQVMDRVRGLKPDATVLTSFSILLAAAKGDIAFFKESARAIDRLTPRSRVLIAEACTHNTLDGDIGRIKIPNILKKKLGDKITVTVVAGADFPQDLSGYDLVIHCGACMNSERDVQHRMECTIDQGVPFTNYGIALAQLTGTLERTLRCFPDIHKLIT